MRFEISTKLRLAIFSVVLTALALAGCMRTPEEKSAAFVQAGKRLLEKKDPARAILQFQNAMQTTPRNAEVYYQLGLAYLAVSDYRQGLVALRKALELNPKHAAAQLRLAQIMAAVDDKEVLKDAQQRLKDLLQDTPQNPDALHTLALTEFKLGDSGTAMEHLQRAAAAAPRELSIAITMAQAKLQQKDPRGAEEVLKKLSDGSPRSAEAHGVFADFYISQKRMPEAEVQVRKAVEIDPKSGAALMTLARLQLTAGRKKEAEQNFRRLAAFEGYYSIYAVFLDQEGRRDESLREFEKVAKAHPADRQARTNLVAAYQSANRLADAKRILGDALKKNPNDLDALLQRGELYIGSGEFPQAEEDLNRIVKARPAAPEVHYVLGKLNQARGKPLIYRQELAEALKLNPFLLPVRVEAAQALISSNSARAALDLLEQAPESQRSSLVVLVQRNWASWAIGDMAQMRRGIDAGLATQRSTDLLLQDGIWKLRSGNVLGARTSLEEALKINPANVLALSALQQSYESQHQTAVAVGKIKEYAAREPRSAPVQNFLGALLLVRGDRSGARSAFQAAKSADPRSIEADLSLSQVDILEGKLDDAQRRLKEVLAANPTNVTARLWMGNLGSMRGNYQNALEHFRSVVDADPNNPQALNNLAYLMVENGSQLTEALKYAQRAKELAPDTPAYADTLGWVLYHQGLYPLAVREFESATSKQANPVWEYHLAMAYAKAGNANRSRALLETALKHNPTLPEAKIAQQIVGTATKTEEGR